MKYYSGKLKKENGTLVHLRPADAKTYELFKNKLQEGDVIEFYAELQQDDGTLAQLAKLHAMIRALALHMGESFTDMKLLVKDRAGLCLVREVAGKEFFVCKSFGDCSREELSLAIQAAIEIGEKVNFLVG